MGMSDILDHADDGRALTFRPRPNESFPNWILSRPGLLGQAFADNSDRLRFGGVRVGKEPASEEVDPHGLKISGRGRTRLKFHLRLSLSAHCPFKHLAPFIDVSKSASSWQGVDESGAFHAGQALQARHNF